MIPISIHQPVASARAISIAAGLSIFASAIASAQDLGLYAGYLEGSIESEIVSPPGNAWDVDDFGGPADGNRIISGLLYSGGDVSMAQLKLTGPGILSFQWNVSSLVNDGWLACQISRAGTSAEVGRISGDSGGWVPMDVFIPQGEHVISWTYRKLSYLTGGDDAGSLANLDFTAIAAAPQSFANYKTAHGVTGPGSTKVGSRRLDTSWLMGLAPDAPAPPALSQVSLVNGEARFRMRHSLSASGLMDPVFSADLKNWDGRQKRSAFVAGSRTPQSIEMEYIVPLADRQFFRCDHPPQVDSLSPAMVYIPPGTYLAGSPKTEVGRVWTGYVSGSHAYEEDTQHQVTLTRGFFLARYETTWAEWVAVRDWGIANGYAIGDGYEARGGRHLLEISGGNGLQSAPAADASTAHPVTNVDFHTAMKWLNAKSEMEGLDPCYYVRLNPADPGGVGEVVVFRNQTFEQIGNGIEDFNILDWNATGYRAPTEAEWEYACRAGTVTALNNGLNLTHGKHYSHWPMLPGEEVELNDPNLDMIASYFGTNVPGTRPVGSFAPNAFGLYDMHGNVFEWCSDLYNSLIPQQFSGEPLVDPKGPTTGGGRMTRGGSWRTPGHMLRSACREDSPTPKGIAGNSHEVGIRYARNAPE